jgi:hypothetical protein
MGYGNYKGIKELTHETLNMSRAEALLMARTLPPDADALVEEWRESREFPSNWLQALLCAAAR